MAKDYLKSSLEKASFNIIIQLVFRGVTFVLNAFVLRHVSPAAVGVMNVRLLLLESTILFLSREAFRRACFSKTSDHNWFQVINLLWLTLPLCQLFSATFGYIWLHVLTPPDASITQYYSIGVWSICLSCIVEMMCEPFYLAAQAFLFIRFKVVLDTIHLTVRTITFTVLTVRDPDSAVLAFATAQLLAAVVYSVSHVVYFHYYMRSMRQKREEAERSGKPMDEEDDFPFESLTDFLPSSIDDQPPINMALASLTWTFLKQGILKQLLTEGERYVMTLLSVLTFSEQGVYDVVNNLGSLAARFLFRPVEESAYFYFAQMVDRDESIQEQEQKRIAESADVLRKLLKVVSSIGLMIVVFGQSYARLLLFLYGGSSLVVGPGPLLMRVHCVAVLMLAINGSTECYAFATMNTEQLDRYNYLMAMLSVFFLVISWGFTTLLGGVGFILANCCNMVARILHSVWIIKNQFQGSSYRPLRGLIPGKMFLVTLVVSALITHYSEVYFFDSYKLVHLGIGGVCFAVVLATWTYEEKDLSLLALQRWQVTDKKKK